MSKTSRRNKWKRILESKMGLWQSQVSRFGSAFTKPGSGK